MPNGTIFTKKTDWLNDLLASSANFIVSGHEKFAERIGISELNTVVLRFFGNRIKTFACILTIESDIKEWSSLSSNLSKKSDCWSLLSELESLLKMKIPILIYDNNSEKFALVNKATRNIKEFDSEELLEFFSRIHPDIIKDPGTFKEINKSLNDAFQIWTRKNLTMYMVINDFDAFSLSLPCIFELKRVQEDLSTWEPYLDDLGNYGALAVISANTNIPLRVIAYQNSNSSGVAIHEILEMSKTMIKGRCALIKPQDIDSSIDIKGFPSCKNYVSTKRRT